MLQTIQEQMIYLYKKSIWYEIISNSWYAIKKPNQANALRVNVV